MWAVKQTEHPLGDIRRFVLVALLRSERRLMSVTDPTLIRQIPLHLRPSNHLPPPPNQFCSFRHLSAPIHWWMKGFRPIQNNNQLFTTQIHNKNMKAGEFQTRGLSEFQVTRETTKLGEPLLPHRIHSSHQFPESSRQSTWNGSHWRDSESSAAAGELNYSPA